MPWFVEPIGVPCMSILAFEGLIESLGEDWEIV